MSANQSLDVKYVAHLARLSLSENEINDFQSQLGEVLEYIESLKKLDVSGVTPTAHAVPRFNVWRDDLEKPSLPVEESLKNAPGKNGELFSVPKVVES
ncbi:Asp-tRNA(Asn)/Glu-tRNA(Gln) amidotransferase subunit GatC [Kamptonema cortianum]|nr:Asp-tRNA(Asn)/Glu-tRNA(Gln) amidotransferase subunit GatC [Kamptonema cortianum]MDL5049729.1 Asp-tRNA(Asn)/Glu-tRNA(Gln) amidotransferase subunit GatC [Oscillatoria amoena NRMC-F 0135]